MTAQRLILEYLVSFVLRLAVYALAYGVLVLGFGLPLWAALIVALACAVGVTWWFLRWLHRQDRIERDARDRSGP